ncbi:MAG: hypothetical protein ABF242_06835 [Flavobacteriales bacterium]
MKKTILLGAAAVSLTLFSCGETTTPEDFESTITEITTEMDVVDEMDSEISAIDNEMTELDEELENL